MFRAPSSLLLSILLLGAWAPITVSAQTQSPRPAPSNPSLLTPPQSTTPPSTLSPALVLQPAARQPVSLTMAPEPVPTRDAFGNPLPANPPQPTPEELGDPRGQNGQPPEDGESSDESSTALTDPLGAAAAALGPTTAAEQGFDPDAARRQAQIRAHAARLQRLQHPRQKGQVVNVPAPVGVAQGSDDRWRQWQHVLVAVDVPAQKVAFEAQRLPWAQFERWAYRQCLDAASRGVECALR
jgi:hypothetical protein